MGAPEAQVAAKRMGSLPGFDVDVVCAETRPKWFREDHTLDEYVRARFGVVRRVGRSPLWEQMPRRLASRAPAVPDDFRSLNLRALHVAEEMLRAGGHSAIVSASQPHSVHLVGLELSRRYDLPWIAHFSDPWTRNPFVHANRLERRLNERLEARVFESADVLVFTSEEAAALCLAGFPARVREKACVLPHPFDPVLYPARQSPARDRRLLRYVGAFYGGRTPRPLVAGLERLDPGLLDRLSIEIVGTVEAGLLEGSQLPDGVVTVIPPVDYVPSLGAMVDADGLLVVDAPAAASPFLPSKLVDYVGAGHPIASLTPPGPAADLTRRLGGALADPSDPDACAAAIHRLLELAEGGRRFGDDHVRETLTVDAVRARMAAIVTGVL